LEKEAPAPKFESIATPRLFLGVVVSTSIALVPHRTLSRSLSFLIAEL
jgi:hypothetical protein